MRSFTRSNIKLAIQSAILVLAGGGNTGKTAVMISAPQILKTIFDVITFSKDHIK